MNEVIMCKAKVRVADNEFKPCSQKAVIMGLCMNHFTMIAYGKKIVQPLKKLRQK